MLSRQGADFAVPASEGAISFDAPKDLDVIREIVLEYLDELVNPENHFYQTSVQDICNECNYRTICGRKKLDF